MGLVTPGVIKLELSCLKLVLLPIDRIPDIHHKAIRMGIYAHPGYYCVVPMNRFDVPSFSTFTMR